MLGLAITAAYADSKAIDVPLKSIFPCPYSLNAQPPEEKWGRKKKGFNCTFQVSFLLTKKGTIFFTLAIVKDAGIDQGMLD